MYFMLSSILLTNWRWKIWQDILIYHINYGFIQGFLALRKAITSQVKKYNIFFSVFDIVDSLLTHYLPFVLPFSVQGCLSEFFQIVAAKTLKNLFRWQTVTLKLSYKGKKQNVKRKTKSYVFSGFGNEISCGWKWKSNTGRFATGWFYALYLFISICCESQLFSSIKGYHVYMN